MKTKRQRYGLIVERSTVYSSEDGTLAEGLERVYQELTGRFARICDLIEADCRGRLEGVSEAERTQRHSRAWYAAEALDYVAAVREAISAGNARAAAEAAFDLATICSWSRLKTGGWEALAIRGAKELARRRRGARKATKKREANLGRSGWLPRALQLDSMMDEPEDRTARAHVIVRRLKPKFNNLSPRTVSDALASTALGNLPAHASVT